MKTTFYFISAIFAIEKTVLIDAYREFEVNGERTILTLQNEVINIQCKSNTQMDYCRFRHPNGKSLAFSGSTLIDGLCTVKIKSTAVETGEWTCHIGKKSGVEVKQKIIVRIVGQLAAVQPNITVLEGDEVTLACATTKTLTPLSYCRFEPPIGPAFSITPDVRRTEAILFKYYFPQNKSLDRGDCAVTIRNVKYEDVGTWTCGAGFSDGKEYVDTINVEVKGLYTMSTASIRGFIWGTFAVGVFLLVLGLVAWKRNCMLAEEEDSEEGHEMQEVAGPVSRRSPTPSPRASPKRTRAKVPIVVVQSPSDSTSSPSD